MAVNGNECWRLIYRGWSAERVNWSDRYSDSFSGGWTAVDATGGSVAAWRTAQVTAWERR